jgi:hypothetical protein
MRPDTTDPLVSDVFDSIDGMDAAGFAKAFTENGSFTFGNAEPVVGREGIVATVAGFFSSIGGLRHEISGVWSGTWEGGDVKSVEGNVNYTRKDGSMVPPIPAVSTLRLRGDLIEDYRIFVDLAPLFSSG